MEGKKPADSTLYAFYVTRVAPLQLDAQLIAQCYGAPNIAGDFDKLESAYSTRTIPDPLTQEKLERIPWLKKVQASFDEAAAREHIMVGNRPMHLGDLVTKYEPMRTQTTTTPPELDVREVQAALRYLKQQRGKAPAA